jgi:acetylornithine/N-succinyldiaminopimelate aminotransferase
MNFEEIKAADQAHIMHTYGRNDVCIVRGKGSRCVDINGKEYIDFTTGIGVNSLGFCDESWVRAVSEQAGTLQHISNLYYTLPDVQLAETLCARTGYARVFLGNSGAEANEGAIKVARKYSFDRYGEKRCNIVTLQNSFHGRTVTTLAATGQEVFHNYFFPFTGGFIYAEANNMEALKAACDESVCAVMLEFIQGEGGVLPLDPEYVRELAAFCKERDILVIADEVQTGIGRTGTLLASEQFGFRPDITTLAKGLGGGLPIGAVLVNDRLAEVMGPSSHGSTFGGNPVVCAGANVVLNRLNDAFLAEVRRKGTLIRAELSGCSEVASVTGLGMMAGIELKNKTSKEVLQDCQEAGLLVLTAKSKVRLLPPLNIPDKDLKKGLEILKKVLDA